MEFFERYRFKEDIYNLFDEINFKAQFFEKSEVFLNAQQLAKKINDDLNLVEFEKLLWYAHKINPEKIQISKNGEKISQVEIESGDIIRLTKKYLTEDHSIVINFAEEFSPSLARLTREFGEYFNCLAYCSIFLNPPNLNCFGAHYDGIDVFAIQIEGEKIWEIGSPIKKLPSKNQIFDLNEDEISLRSYNLKAGDLLYVPRGFIHNVKSNDNYSLHISIGLASNRRVDIYGELLKTIETEDQEMRTTLKGSLSKGYEYIQDELSADKILNKFSDPFYIRKSVNQLNAKKISQLALLPSTHVKQSLEFFEISLESEVIVAEGVIIEVNTLNNEKVIMSYPSNLNNSDQWVHSSISLPLLALVSLEFIRDSKTSFLIKDILGLISNSSKMTLVKELIIIGVLKHVDK